MIGGVSCPVTERETTVTATDMATIAIPIVAGVVGAFQCGLITYGFRLMRVTTDQRRAEEDHRHAEVMAALDRQHTASMAALETLIERTAPKGGSQ